MIINFDLSQIEIIVAAQLSQDQSLIELLNKDIDIYRYFASIMYNKLQYEVTKEERDSLKIPILGINYGKGYMTLANETGKSEDWCKKFIDAYYAEFPAIKLMHTNWTQEVNKTGMLKMFDGLNLQFKYYEKTWSDEYNCWFKAGYKPTEIKNYPIQHTAFVILSLFLSTLWREKVIYKRDKYLLICTIHDSIMLDCKPEYIEEAKQDVQEILAKLSDLLYNMYELKMTVPIRAEITCGESWYDLN